MNGTTRTAPRRPRPCALALVVTTAACASPPDFVNRPPRPVAWPSPTAAQRVDLEFVYGGNQDVVQHPGWVASLWNLLAGTEDVRLTAPSGLAVAGDVLWVTDPGGACVHRIDLATGEHRRTKGLPEAPFATPVGVAALPDGSVWVTDSAKARITVLDAEGQAVRSLGEPGQFERPTGLCFDAGRSRMLVVDTVACRLVALAPDGRCLATVGSRGAELGQFNYPTNVAVNAGGSVAVVDSLNFRVQLLSPDLRPIGAFGQVGRGPGDFANPKGLAIDSANRIHVVDSMFDNIQIFDREGQLLLAVATSGSGFGQLYLPSGIHIGADDRIYVSDAGNSRVQVMQLTGGSP